MRLREWFRDFGRSICGSTHSSAYNVGFKKSAAYQTFGRKHRVKDDVIKRPCPVMDGIFQNAIYMHAGVSSKCCDSQKCYKSREVYFGLVEFFKHYNVRFNVQGSEVQG